MEQITYLGTILADRISIQEETVGRLKSENVCYNSVQNFCL